MNPTALTHTTLIHIGNDLTDGLFDRFYAALPVTGNRILPLHDGVLTPVLACALCGRLH